VAQEERQQAAQGRAALLSEDSARTVDRHLLRADGSRVPVEVSGSLVTIGEESLAVLILRDVTERVQAELRLRESEKQYRLLFDSNPHPMWVYDPATLAFLAVNQAAVRLYGYTRDEFRAMTIADLGPPEDLVPPWDGEAGAASGFSRHRRKGGAALDVDIVSSVIVFRGTPARLVLAMDMSDKKRLEAQLLQAQKMEAVGRLAGGVAHDFNNLLGVITGYSDLLSKNLEAGHPGRKRLEQIQRAAERATGLTRQLLAFSRKQVLEPKVLDLNEVVADVEKMLDRLIGEDVQLVTVFGSDLGKVRADRGQVEQVLLNLVVNARDAMPRGGRLLLETSNAVLDQAYARLHPEARPGPYVLLAVSDTGHGMDAQTQSHIFEPFFTTKEEGKGTGLGLATVFGIVSQSGGSVDVYSELDWGTTFRIYLPRIDDESAVASRPASASPAPAGTETILLVEDAEPLRVMIREILEGGGYTVIEATDPEQALAGAQAPGRSIHLLLTDVVMPRMSGPELAERLRSGATVSPRVLYMSGYTDEAIGHHGVLEPGTHFLQKPFTSEALLRKVRDALDAGGP
jgi:PAS domain S-box-containing protein